MMTIKKKTIMISILCISIICLLSILIATYGRYNPLRRTCYKPISMASGRIKWARNPSCNYYMTKILQEIVDENGLQETKGDDYILYFPCTYNFVNHEINKIKPDQNNMEQRFFIVDGCDQLTSKAAIWKNLYNLYGDRATEIMPRTYLTTDNGDMAKFKHNFRSGQQWIMKKNIQRQEGLKLTNKLSDVTKGLSEGYVVVQKVLQDPYIVGGRKINQRFYLLLVCRNGNVTGYVHSDGFMYYTKVKYQKGVMERDNIITTGYIDRKVYEENPLTNRDFMEYLDDKSRDLTDIEKQEGINGRLSEIVFNRIYHVIGQVVNSIKGVVCQGRKLYPYTTFQLFGVDIALNENLHPHVMEVNKGPDMSAKDKRDKAVKHRVMTDIFRVVKVLPGEHEFVTIFKDGKLVY